MSLGKIDQLRRRSQPFNQIFAQYNQDNTLYFCISLFFCFGFHSSTLLFGQSQQFRLQSSKITFLSYCWGRTTLFPKKLFVSHKNCFKSLVQNNLFSSKTLLRYGDVKALCHVKWPFLSSVIFVYCLRSIEDNCTVPRVYCQTTLDKSQVYRTVFLGIAVATAVVWLPLSRPARSSFARRGKHHLCMPAS